MLDLTGVEKISGTILGIFPEVPKRQVVPGEHPRCFDRHAAAKNLGGPTAPKHTAQRLGMGGG
jgi:hypothetical protein